MAYSTTSGSVHAEEMWVYFGTSTREASKGIYFSRLDLKTGRLTDPVLAAEARNPGFLAIHPNRQFLYSIGQRKQGDEGGGVMAFRIEADGNLTFLNQRSSGGAGPTHLVVDRGGRNVLVANYGGGSVACLPIQADGQLGAASAFAQHQGSSVNQQRQTGPHAHGIYTDLRDRFVFVPDLGLDQVVVYRFDPETGGLKPNDPPFAAVAPGSGPRHFAFSPNGRFGYVINEMLCTITAFRYDGEGGRLSEIQTVSTLPDGEVVQPSFSTAEIFAHPSGKFLYGSNRGHDTLAVFRINAEDGKLSLVEHEPTQAKIPRGFGIDPTGKFLIVGGQNSDNAVVFRVEEATGRLTPTGQTVRVGSPICVEFVPRTQF